MAQLRYGNYDKSFFFAVHPENRCAYEKVRTSCATLASVAEEKLRAIVAAKKWCSLKWWG
jgi:hypothetical protein